MSGGTLSLPCETHCSTTMDLQFTGICVRCSWNTACIGRKEARGTRSFWLIGMQLTSNYLKSAWFRPPSTNLAKTSVDCWYTSVWLGIKVAVNLCRRYWGRAFYLSVSYRAIFDFHSSFCEFLTNNTGGGQMPCWLHERTLTLAPKLAWRVLLCKMNYFTDQVLSYWFLMVRARVIPTPSMCYA